MEFLGFNPDTNVVEFGGLEDSFAKTVSIESSLVNVAPYAHFKKCNWRNIIEDISSFESSFFVKLDKYLSKYITVSRW